MLSILFCSKTRKGKPRVLLNVEPLEDRTLLAGLTLYWTGGAANPWWSLRGNWSVKTGTGYALAPRIPGKDDNAFFSNAPINLGNGFEDSQMNITPGYEIHSLILDKDFTGSIKLFASFTIGTLHDSSQGTINLNGKILFDHGGSVDGGVSEWTSGIIRGNSANLGVYLLSKGFLAPNAAIMRIGTNNQQSSTEEPVLYGAKFQIGGPLAKATAEWEGGDISVRNYGGFKTSSGPDSEFVINSKGGTIGGSETNTYFDNQGKVIANVSANIKMPFNNAGRTIVNGGTLRLYRGGASSRSPEIGSAAVFTVAPNAEISFFRMTYSWLNGTIFTGDGLVSVYGTVVVQTAVKINNFGLFGGTVTNGTIDVVKKLLWNQSGL